MAMLRQMRRLAFPAMGGLRSRSALPGAGGIRSIASFGTMDVRSIGFSIGQRPMMGRKLSLCSALPARQLGVSRRAVHASAAAELIGTLVSRQAKEGDSTDKTSGEGAQAGKDESNEQEEEEEYDDVDINDIPWLQLFMVVTLVGVCGFFFVYIIRELLPTSTSAITIKNLAVHRLTTDPEVQQQFGEVTKSFGVDGGGHAEGRRHDIKSYTYERKAKKFTRIKFGVESSHGMGIVWAEVCHDNPSEFHYLQLTLPNGKTMSITDERPPELSRPERQHRVSQRLLTVAHTYYQRDVVDAVARQQATVMGKQWAYITKVDCSTAEGKCEREGIEAPAWSIQGKKLGGFLTLDQLEEELQIVD